MIAVLFLAFAFSLIGGVTTGYLLLRRAGKEERELEKGWQAYRQQLYANCTVMWETARTEEGVYGTIISGSIYNHIKDCNHCLYVLEGKSEYLVKHRDDMRKLERSWKDERRASNAA